MTDLGLLRRLELYQVQGLGFPCSQEFLGFAVVRDRKPHDVGLLGRERAVAQLAAFQVTPFEVRSVTGRGITRAVAARVAADFHALEQGA